MPVIQSSDPTSKRLPNAQLETLLALFGGLTEIPFFAKDTSLRYTAANEAMAATCGVDDPAQMIGRTVHEYFPPELAQRFEALDRFVLSTGKVVSRRLVLSAKLKKEPTWILLTRVPLRGEDGTIVGVAACAREFPTASRSNAIYSRVERAARHIERAFPKPVRLRQLAKVCGVSISQLERDFAHVFGETPVAIHEKVRIGHALELLERPLSIQQIAQACGYSDHSAFTRRFRETVGMSPRAYRKSLARTDATSAVLQPARTRRAR